MTSRFITCGCFLALLAPAIAQGQTAIPVNQLTPATPVERLALDTAVQLAVDNNRQLKSAMLQVENAGDQIAIARSRRLPSFDTEVNASQLLSPVTFSFPKGAFGDFPGTG